MSNPLYDSDINKVGHIDQAANSPNSILNNMQSAKKRNDTNGGCSLYFEELLMTDKPNVSWNEVIGLEDAKRAMRESIVYPTIRPDLLPLGWARGIYYLTSWLWKDVTRSGSRSRNRRLFHKC